MAGEKPQPRICATISLDPTTHSFSSSQAPNLNLTIILDHDEPITIYADDLSPSLMIARGAFTIRDHFTGLEMKQTKRTHCRIPPPTKVEVTLNEDMFYTLQPSIPLMLSTPFARDSEKPRAGSDPEFAGRRSCGVDGLEPDRQYVLTLASSPRIFWYHVRWWQHGTKEDVLGAVGLDPRKVKFKPGPQQAIEIDTSGIRPVTFQCIQ